MSIENDQLEEDILEALGPLEEPDTIPIIDPDGQAVGKGFVRRLDFYRIINSATHPEIFERLKGKIIAIVQESRVRIFDDLDEFQDVFNDVATSVRLVGGPAIGGEITLEELEGQ